MNLVRDLITTKTVITLWYTSFHTIALYMCAYTYITLEYSRNYNKQSGTENETSDSYQSLEDQWITGPITHPFLQNADESN